MYARAHQYDITPLSLFKGSMSSPNFTFHDSSHLDPVPETILTHCQLDTWEHISAQFEYEQMSSAKRRPYWPWRRQRNCDLRKQDILQKWKYTELTIYRYQRCLLKKIYCMSQERFKAWFVVICSDWIQVDFMVISLTLGQSYGNQPRRMLSNVLITSFL